MSIPFDVNSAASISSLKYHYITLGTFYGNKMSFDKFKDIMVNATQPVDAKNEGSMTSKGRSTLTAYGSTDENLYWTQRARELGFYISGDDRCMGFLAGIHSDEERAKTALALRQGEATATRRFAEYQQRHQNSYGLSTNEEDKSFFHDEEKKKRFDGWI